MSGAMSCHNTTYDLLFDMLYHLLFLDPRKTCHQTTLPTKLAWRVGRCLWRWPRRGLARCMCCLATSHNPQPSNVVGSEYLTTIVCRIWAFHEDYTLQCHQATRWSNCHFFDKYNHGGNDQTIPVQVQHLRCFLHNIADEQWQWQQHGTHVWIECWIIWRSVQVGGW